MTFRIRAVNSVYKGEYSDSKEVIVGHSILEDSIQALTLGKVSNKMSKVTFFGLKYCLKLNQFDIFLKKNHENFNN